MMRINVLVRCTNFNNNTWIQILALIDCDLVFVTQFTYWAYGKYQYATPKDVGISKHVKIYTVARTLLPKMRTWAFHVSS